MRMRMRLKKGMWSFQSILLSVIEPIRISIRLNGPLTRKTGRADISEEGTEYYEIYNFFYARPYGSPGVLLLWAVGLIPPTCYFFS